LVKFGPLFLGAQILDSGYLEHFCRRVTKFNMIRSVFNGRLLLEFRKLWSGGSAIPCGDMHQFLIDDALFRTFVT